jgi:hypothetical protein
MDTGTKYVAKPLALRPEELEPAATSSVVGGIFFLPNASLSYENSPIRKGSDPNFLRSYARAPPLSSTQMVS